MATIITREFGLFPTLVRGRGGIFDVTVDGTLIYSKHQTGRFPQDFEIIQAIQSLRSMPDQ